MGAELPFNLSLLDQTPLQIWRSGTLTLSVDDSNNVSGSISLPDYYQNPIPFRGTAANSFGQTGMLVGAEGSSSEAEVNLAFICRVDGFLTNGTFLGGMATILDFQAQETYLYVMQGYMSGPA